MKDHELPKPNVPVRCQLVNYFNRDEKVEKLVHVKEDEVTWRKIDGAEFDEWNWAVESWEYVTNE